ncbi:MAG: hypothetical protein JJU05_02695 [Verrucomicrobia bacterium]|nr:hypothetical protein [Verrucomicrobiota bacterium]MCH8527654.1 hypothetical protein [Kiritimatiellia bacterium]
MILKRRRLGIIALFAVVFSAGIFLGSYVTAVRYEYRISYGEGSKALIQLDLLNNNRTETVVDINKGNLVASFAAIRTLPGWSQIFNPSQKDSPKPAAKMETYQKIIELLEGHFALEVYGISQRELNEILESHFAHYQVFTMRMD